MTRLPEHPLPPKPRFREPCNGCGLCCHVELCHAAETADPQATAPCQFLEFRDGRTFCGLVTTEIAFGLPPYLQELLAIGGGCSMPDVTV